MKKITLLLFTLCIFCSATMAQTKNPNHKWFDEARFGLFVHFGPYAVLAEGEWVLDFKRLKADDYQKLQKIFNPQAFDAKEWVRIAKNAGMKYITFTTRHHDSFSNWDTKQSDWNIMNTPYGKDLVRQLADECHKEGIKLVLYYSLTDWVREDYGYKTGRTGQHTGRTHQGEWMSYINFMKAQLTELLTNYGDIAGIWFDGEWDQMPHESKSHSESALDWHLGEIYDLIHSLQPDCMVANNHHLDPLRGEDYQAFEKDLPGQNLAGFGPNQEISTHLPLETCETMNNTWGFNIGDNNYKSVKTLIHYLVNAAGHGANLLLNVGPMPNGEIQEEFVVRLAEIGKWTSTYGQTIYGTEGGIVKPQSWGAVTRKDNIHYIHVLNKEGEQLAVNFPKDIKSAKWLNIDADLIWKRNKKTGDTTFDLNVPLDDIDSIIEVIMK